MLLVIVRVLVGLLGLSLVIATMVSAMRTFVLPRSAPDPLTRAVFVGMRWLFHLRVRRMQTYLERDRVLELYAPLSLLSLPPTWLALVLMGYMGLYWALGVSPWYDAFRTSGSALLTLGFAPGDGVLTTALMFSEATLGLLLVALLIAYLPTMYAAFSRREALVTLLEVRAGSPPSALTMLIRFHRMRDFNALWQPGYDHAGIALQNVMVRRLAAEGTDYRELGRGAFVEKCWEFIRDYGGQIMDQLRSMGASLDYRRHRFWIAHPIPKPRSASGPGIWPSAASPIFSPCPTLPIRTSRPSRSVSAAPSSMLPVTSSRATVSPSKPTGTSRGATSRGGV